jgi:peroxiredoxin
MCMFAALGLVAGLTACGNDPLAEQYRAGDHKGFIAADGFQTAETDPSDRGDPVSFTGTTDHGEQVSSADYTGSVLVVNFWYAACGPCRAEAEHLEAAYTSFSGQDVAFLGINTSDSAASSIAFAEKFGVTYPSALAAQDAELKLAFAADTPLNATPTTLVLDKQGRVAARVIGPVSAESVSSFETIIRDILAES